MIVFSDDPEKWSEDSRWVRAVRTDSEGRYEVKGLPPGEYRAIALEYAEAMTRYLLRHPETRQVLETAHLITKSRDAQYRPCKLNGPALKDVADWVEQYRAFWEESFDRLEEYLKAIQKPDTKPATKKQKK